MAKQDTWQKLYESLIIRTEALQKENKALRAQLIVAEAQGKSWELDKANQQQIIQYELTKLNTECQGQREEIVRLRTLLKEYTDVC